MISDKTASYVRRSAEATSSLPAIALDTRRSKYGDGMR